MKNYLQKFFESEYVLPKIFAGLIVSIVIWALIRPNVTTPEMITADETKNAARNIRSSRLKNKIAKDEFRLKMLEQERALKAKYAHKRKIDSDFQGSRKGRQAWETDKQRTKRYYSKFKNDRTRNPNSVKMQLKKSLQQLDEDKPL